MAARKLIALGASVALAGLTGCAPRGPDDVYGVKQEAPPFVAVESASPVSTAPAQPLTESLKAVTIAKMGKVVVDQKGWVLYRFDKDTANPPKSNCDGKCAQVWPPALTDGNPDLTGIDPSIVGFVIRGDGSSQITLAGWPIYRYIGDPKPGAWKGQNVNGTWFVVAPTGKKNLSCLPTPAPTAVAPPASKAASPAATRSSAAADDGYNDGSGY